MDHNETVAASIIDNHIVPAFAEHGVKLDFIPANEDWRDLWQFDGGLDGVCIQLTVGTNGHGLPGIFGEFSMADGQSFDLSGRAENWMEDFEAGIPAMVAGKAPF